MVTKPKAKRGLYPSSESILKKLKQAEKILSSPEMQITPPTFALGPKKNGKKGIIPTRKDNLRINKLLHGAEVYHSPRNRTRVIISNPMTPYKAKLLTRKKRKSYEEFMASPLNDIKERL